MVKERDELQKKFINYLNDIQQKSNLKNILLEKKLSALSSQLEKKEAELSQILAISNLDPSATNHVTTNIEVNIK